MISHQPLSLFTPFNFFAPDGVLLFVQGATWISRFLSLIPLLLLLVRSAAHHFLLVVVFTTMQGAAHFRGQSHAVARSSVYGGPLLYSCAYFWCLHSSLSSCRYPYYDAGCSSSQELESRGGPEQRTAENERTVTLRGQLIFGLVLANVSTGLRTPAPKSALVIDRHFPCSCLSFAK